MTIAEGALPTSQAFSGVASTPGTGGTSIVSWQWTIIDKPPGSAAALVGATTMTPTLTGIDTLGNVLLGLSIVDDVGGASETNTVMMLDAARVTFRVTAAATGLQKLAAGERNYMQFARDETQAVEDLRKDVDDFNVQDLADVNEPTSTGPNLDRLMDGSYASDDGLSTGLPLHLHPVDTVDPATMTGRGAVKLSTAPLDPANPVAVSAERFTLCGTIDGTPETGAYVPGKIGLVTFGGAISQCHLHWYAHEAFDVVAVTISMADAGYNVGAGYRYHLLLANEAQFIANDFAGMTLVASMNISAPTVTHAPSFLPFLSIPTLSQAVAAQQILLIRCVLAPAAAADQGGGLSVVLHCRKRW